MVRVNRTISAEEEYINLMVEIVYLEEDLANGRRASLDALLDYHFDQLHRGQFQVAVLIIQKVHELSPAPGRQSRQGRAPRRVPRPHGAAPRRSRPSRSLLARKKALDWESLLGFFGLLGPPAARRSRPTSSTSRPTARPGTRSSAFIERTGAPHPALLAGLADNAPARAWPASSSASCPRIPGGRGIPHLSAFLSFQDRDVKSEAIRVLGRARDEMANRILAGFLNDPDEEVRIQAAMTLDPVRGRGARPAHPARGLGARVPGQEPQGEERPCSRSSAGPGSPEALEFLRRTLLRAPLFASTRGAWSSAWPPWPGLEGMATDEAVQASSGRARSAGRRRSARPAPRRSSACLLCGTEPRT